MSVCPTCGAAVVSRCRCGAAESECANGHRWHHHWDKTPVQGWHDEDCNGLPPEADLALSGHGVRFLKRVEP